MPVFVKVVLYFVILVGLSYALQSIPRGEHDVRLLVSLVGVGWMLGGIIIAIRSAVRFVMR